jgi:two-component system, chemotaxis family, CheB/CheR fusion protein
MDSGELHSGNTFPKVPDQHLNISSTEKSKVTELSKNLFPVVGIGASAGGLESFKKLVRAIPEKSGMAYILVQHLHPDHSSALPEILQRECGIPVQEIRNNMEVMPDNVYIIPANKMLVATDGILQISPRPSKDRKNMPIDVFFSSLADVHQSHAIGIVLSGSGIDGTIGLKNIKAQGGITFAQDLESAAYDAMPSSAINAEVVDFILPPEKMPLQLLELSRKFSLLSSEDIETDAKLTENESFNNILTFLRTRNGVDFTYYKQTTIRRRILRRLAILNLNKVADYFEFLKQNKPERDILFNDLLIPVTSFFRDPKTFEYLRNSIFPELIKNKSLGKPLRIWIAGCSTGEEAYSVGICLHEYLSDKVSTIKIQIFATDTSEKSITKARVGLYASRDLEGVSEQRLQQYFIKTTGGYQVKKIIRDMCVFAFHNFLKDPPFAKMDLLSCRNVLIYLEPFLQKKAFNTFHYALNDKGYLLLGNSETIGSASDLFLPFEKKEKLYTRKTLPGRIMNVTTDRGEEVFKAKDFGLRSNERKRDDFQKKADEILLSKFTPAGVIVNDQLDILQFRGSTGEFLEASPGKASLNVLKMARESLSFELRSALHKSKITKEAQHKEGISIDNGKRLVTIDVIPLLNNIEPYFLILFSYPPNARKLADSKDKSFKSLQTGLDIRNKELESELTRVREDMRTISEDQEAANEELQSANEELLSGSEELQSLNEELETSKEELQSTNEELITVNQELFDRNEQLNQARLYAEAIVKTIHEPLLVLNQDFRIVSANKSFHKVFSLSEEESIGKILFDLQNKGWEIPKLRTQLLNIQTTKEEFLEWEITYAFPSIGKRTFCLNAQPIKRENGEDWILLAFNDITLWKDKERMEKKNADDLKKILETLPQMTLTVSPDGDITYFNQFSLDYLGMSLEQALNCNWETVIAPEVLTRVIATWRDAVATEHDFNMEFQIKRQYDDLYRWHLCRASAIRNEDGIITSWVGAAIDVHDQKTKEQVKDEFINIASHELKTPLTTAKAYIDLVRLNMGKTNSENLPYVQKAGESINRLNDLIGELLDVSKIKNGKLDLNITKFDFNEMITSTIEGVQLISPRHKILQTGEINEPVTADRERLQQVFLNLLTNAVKYSPDTDEVFVNIVKENSEIKVSVTDSGIGIRRENINKIFSLYYREEGRAIHFQGLGIGLSISQEIIQRHKGRIWVESEADKGSTFSFTIPI